MKWFKHLSTARNDEKLSLVIDELGLEGYGFYMMLLEIVSEKITDKNESFAEFSSKKWGSFFQFSAKKFEKFAGVLEKHGLIILKSSENYCRVEIPNLLKYRDNHTRNLQVADKPTDKQLRKDLALEEDKEEDKEEELETEVKDVVNTRADSGESTCTEPEAEPEPEKPKIPKPEYRQEFELVWTRFLKFNRPGDKKNRAWALFENARKTGYTVEEIQLCLNALARDNKTRSESKYFTPFSVYLHPMNIDSAIAGDSEVERIATDFETPKHTRNNIRVMQELLDEGYGQSSPEQQKFLEVESA